MGVNNGDLADQTQFNASFMDREADTSTIGRVGLLSPNVAVSGPTIPDAQLKINQAKYYAHTSIDALGVGASIPLSSKSDFERRSVKSTGGTVMLAGVLFGAGPFVDGQRVRVTGVDATDKVQLQNFDSAGGTLLNGAAVELGLFDSIEFEYYLTFDRWVEMRRNF